MTSYQARFKGKQIPENEVSRIVDANLTSCLMGGVIPDPTMMRKTNTRFANFSDDLKKMTNSNSVSPDQLLSRTQNVWINKNF